MTRGTDNGSFLRRGGDFPVLVLSQDYELFFQKSGSIEKCILEPSRLLLDFARQSGVRITFFVDAGMLCRMEDLASANPLLGRELSRLKQHIENIAREEHEIGLHIHPHWQDTRWHDGEWDFSGTRYKLDHFTDDEVASIVARYAATLNELCDGSVTSYRAGGFCIEPFSRIRQGLAEAGISIDSSVVPGARLTDAAKGFDFSAVPDEPWWRFARSPLQAEVEGDFLEVPITPLVLPVSHYWGRAFDRVLRRQPATVLGDGLSKAIGRPEIVRRLAALSRVSELSTDAPKAGKLSSSRVRRQEREIWHIMGHPKLLGQPSLAALKGFIDQMRIQRFQTISALGGAIRAGECGNH